MWVTLCLLCILEYECDVTSFIVYSYDVNAFHFGTFLTHASVDVKNWVVATSVFLCVFLRIKHL